MLRPRTGSNQTQDRHASGGALITGATPLRALLSDASRRACYLLYRKVRPATHEAVVHTPTGDALALGGDGDGGGGDGGGGATSEVATFGVFLSSRGGGEELRNQAAGVGARTRPADPAHPHSAGLGYGALSCVQVRRRADAGHHAS